MRLATIGSTILVAMLLCVGGVGTSVLMARQEGAGSKQPGPSAAVCERHAAPKDQCFICDPKLRETGRLWCEEHDRYEDRCWICHPEGQDKQRLYCKEHSLYEDECFLCHPELKKKAGKPSK